MKSRPIEQVQLAGSAGQREEGRLNAEAAKRRAEEAVLLRKEKARENAKEAQRRYRFLLEKESPNLKQRWREGKRNAERAQTRYEAIKRRYGADVDAVQRILGTDLKINDTVKNQLNDYPAKVRFWILETIAWVADPKPTDRQLNDILSIVIDRLKTKQDPLNPQVIEVEIFQAMGGGWSR